MLVVVVLSIVSVILRELRLLAVILVISRVLELSGVAGKLVLHVRVLLVHGLLVLEKLRIVLELNVLLVELLQLRLRLQLEASSNLVDFLFEDHGAFVVLVLNRDLLLFLQKLELHPGLFEVVFLFLYSLRLGIVLIFHCLLLQRLQGPKINT